MISLLKKTSLTFSREAAGFYNDVGDWVAGAVSNFTARGSLQSFRRGNRQLQLPDGVTTADARVFYTTTKLKSSDEFDETQADSTTIDGRVFYVKEIEDNTGFGLIADHFKCLLIRKDK